MSERLEVSPENYSRQATVRRLLGRAGVCLAGGALMAAPYAFVSSLSHTEVHDDLGPVPASVKFAPGHSSIDLGVLGAIYDESLTGAGVGLNVEVDGPPSILESIDTNNPDRLVKPFAALYQDPTGALEGYRVAMEHEIKRELLTTELRTTAALSTLAFIIASLGSNVPSRERKRYLAATFGGISMLSILASADMYHQWQEEHAHPAVNYPVAAISSPEHGTITASNRLLASIIDRAAPLIEEQRERNTQETERFITTARRSIDQQLILGTFVPPRSDETLVLALSDLHSNHAMIEVYQYLVEQINERYGEHTLELTLLVGDQTYGSATEKGAVDAISQISSDIYGISGNHDGPLIKQQAESRGITMLNGSTVTATNDIRILGAPDPMLTKLPALFGFSEDVLRNKEIGSQEELGELLADEAKETNPTFVLSHEAYALNSLIDKDDISLHSMEQWLGSGTEYANISSAAVLYGHWHRQFDYRIVRDDDGKGTIVAELGTSGGASGKMSLSSLSFPWTTPAKKASAVLFRVDTDRQLVTGIQEVNTRTSGEVMFQPAETIMQPSEVDSESKDGSAQDNTSSVEDKKRKS